MKPRSVVSKMILLLGLLLPIVTDAAAPASGWVRGLPSPVSLEARVLHQRAIEEVLWQNRLWPAENPNPKPALETVMPLSVIQAKVEDSLRLSNALEQFWGEPITGAQLQAEMERQARDTKQPELLRQLWAALGDDPHLIAEMLARPALAERLASNWSQGSRMAGNLSFETWWQRVKGGLLASISEPSYAYQLPRIESILQAPGTWTPTFALPEAESAKHRGLDRGGDDRVGRHRPWRWEVQFRLAL